MRRRAFSRRCSRSASVIGLGGAGRGKGKGGRGRRDESEPDINSFARALDGSRPDAAAAPANVALRWTNSRRCMSPLDRNLEERISATKRLLRNVLVELGVELGPPLAPGGAHFLLGLRVD